MRHIYHVCAYLPLYSSGIPLNVSPTAWDTNTTITITTKHGTRGSADFQRRENPPMVVIASYSGAWPVGILDHQPNTSSNFWKERPKQKTHLLHLQSIRICQINKRTGMVPSFGFSCDFPKSKSWRSRSPSKLTGRDRFYCRTLGVLRKCFHNSAANDGYREINLAS